MKGPLRTHCIPNVPVIFPSFHRILKQVYHREKRILFSVQCFLFFFAFVPVLLPTSLVFFLFVSYLRSFHLFLSFFLFHLPISFLHLPLSSCHHCLFLLSHATCVPFSLVAISLLLSPTFDSFHLYFFLLATCLFHLFLSLYS